MQRLSSVEVQRVQAVLEETVDKLAFLGSIQPDVLAHRDELSQFMGDEISRIIREQRALEKRYEELIAQRGALKGLSNKTRYKENQREIQDVSRALRESTKKLCRNLKDNPNIGANLIKIQNERAQLEELLRRVSAEIRDGMFDSLVGQVEEEKRRRRQLESLVEREKEAAAAVTQLKEDLAREKAEHEREIADRKSHISTLKEQLHEIKSKTTVKTKFARREAEARIGSTVRAYRLQEMSLRTNIDLIRMRREVEGTVSKETVDFLKAKQKELSRMAREWEEKCEVDLEAKTAELERVREARERDLEQLQRLEERRQRELADEAARKAEEERLRELAQLRAQEDQRNAQAALVIQAAFRSHMQRAQAARKAASSKKKGGKKGKGKGKKGGKKGKKGK